MGQSEQALRERMTWFWHNHFSSHSRLSLYVQQHNNLLRKHALGSYRDMLREVVKGATVLDFLNANKNVKAHPNENLGRELMEIFTLGRGQYTEDDVKNAARALTGWRYTFDGQFFTDDKTHDEGDKTFFGKTGNFNGDDILDAILARRDTAVHVCRRLYRHFVNDQPDETRVQELATVFFDSSYDITKLMRHLLLAPWFYGEPNRGSRVKSPIELLIGLNRTFHITYNKKISLIRYQKLFAQVLFYPPNIGGWPKGMQWIDSSSLLLRLKIPEYLFLAEEFRQLPKGELSTEGTFQELDNDNEAVKGQVKNLGTQFDWAPIEQIYSQVPELNLLLTAIDRTLASPLDPRMIAAIQKHLDTSNRTQHLHTALLRCCGLPEYQFC